MNEIKSYYLLALLLMILLTACSNPEMQKTETASQEQLSIDFQNKGHELVYQMVQKVGDYQQLLDQKDVTYTYTYRTPSGKEDISTEQYIFDGEMSLGIYEKHERTFSELEGVIVQGFDGQSFWLKHNDQVLKADSVLKSTAFTRKTNFYWFAMMQKLLDPGIIYKHLGSKTVNGQNYELVSISFESDGIEPTDIYQLYINSKTLLVDQFLFTVVARGVKEHPLLMKVEYKEIEGILLPTYRKYTKSNWEAEVLADQWAEEIMTNIQFNKQVKKELFKATL